MQEQLKPKKKRSFKEWVKIRKIDQRNVKTCFTVPPHILSLPCGCSRKGEDVPFLVKIEEGKLIHNKEWGSRLNCLIFSILENKREEKKYGHFVNYCC